MSTRPPEIAAAAERVFPGSKPGFPNWPPAADIEARGILALGSLEQGELLNTRALSEEQVSAIARAASEIGDEPCFLTFTDRYDPGHGAFQDFEMDRLDARHYFAPKEIGDFSHIVVAQSRRWGVVVNQEGIALIAGPRRFVESINRALPDRDELLAAFAADVVGLEIPAYTKWLRRVLRDVLGAESAEKVIAAAEADC